MSGSDADPFIVLAGGFVIRTEVQRWLAMDASWRLRFRIIDGELDVSPRSAITPADDQFIRQHVGEIKRALDYCETAWPQ